MSHKKTKITYFDYTVIIYCRFVNIDSVFIYKYECMENINYYTTKNANRKKHQRAIISVQSQFKYEALFYQLIN